VFVLVSVAKNVVIGQRPETLGSSIKRF